MKSTDIAKRDRELKRARKKQELIGKRSTKKSDLSVGQFIDKLFSMFYCDKEKIFNITDSTDILEVLAEMKKALPEKQWENVLRKSIKKTQVAQKEEAYQELSALL